MVAVNKIPMMFAPAITCVFLLGVFWKRGTKQAAMTTFIFGTVIGLVYFLIDLPAKWLVGDTQIVTQTWGIPFMQVGWWLFCMCSVVYVMVSFLTPAPSAEELGRVGWEPPLRAIARTRITKITDPRSIATGLFVLMIVLYFWLR